MKKIFIMLCIFIIGFANIVYAFQNEPNKFRGIQWGHSLANIKGMTQTEPPDRVGVACYKRKDDKLQIGESTLTSIQYCAFKDKFYLVEIDFAGSDNFSRLAKIFLQLYGAPQNWSDNNFTKFFVWQSNKLKISLLFGKNIQEGTLNYEYLPIKKKRDKERDRLLELSRKKRIDRLKQQLGSDL